LRKFLQIRKTELEEKNGKTVAYISTDYGSKMKDALIRNQYQVVAKNIAQALSLRRSERRLQSRDRRGKRDRRAHESGSNCGDTLALLDAGGQQTEANRIHSDPINAGLFDY